jgi:hypothetical protein
MAKKTKKKKAKKQAKKKSKNKAKNQKKIIGLTEDLVLIGEKKRKKVVAKIDTGADKSSIDMNLAAELKLGPVVKTRLIRSASGSLMRPIIRAKVVFAKRKMGVYFTIADRAHMKYRVLIGKNILKKGFLIDPSRE